MNWRVLLCGFSLFVVGLVVGMGMYPWLAVRQVVFVPIMVTSTAPMVLSPSVPEPVATVGSTSTEAATSTIPSVVPRPVLDPACGMRPETGLCKAAFTRYFFNRLTQTCQPFTWGGCGGSVPFETLSACRKVCEGS